MSTEIQQRICSKSSCKSGFPPIEQYKWKTCPKHREDSRVRQSHTHATESHTPINRAINGNPAIQQPLGDIQPLDFIDHRTPLKRRRTEGKENEEEGASGSESEKLQRKRLKAHVYRAWATFSETLWCQNDNQLSSAQELLGEMKLTDEVDVFELDMAPGITALAWGLKKVVKNLKDQIVEIALDATYNTNVKDLELYSCMREYDNAGFPLAYCLLTTASSITPGKRKITLTSFLRALKDCYAINPHFVHTDKDIAEIKSANVIWTSSKHQLCWWHTKKAVNTRLKKSKHSTTPYDPLIPRQEFDFIDLAFVPSVKADPQDVEDSEDLPLPSKPPPAPPACTLTSIHPISQPGPNTLPIKIKIPTGYQMPELPAESEVDSDDEVPKNGLRSFCPSIYHENIIQMMERHLCAHPLIPGYSAPSKAGIQAWAVKEMYSFCLQYNLHSCWAYLWGNWYKRGCWELWAWAECDEIP
ncbi:hypothetical protein M422DRAFT_273913 [Sphaerobolus stellatus SS14]|uniref:Unplaced genomic scaffold SPHSTscaffold_356, whole genome shotgun sequence n=1 Tax=Sphaerobolus stellatus (strain SS14) TaxID=990650 RepID=A0A0C9UIB1_SPHS4|nr:hypothetical protein M422DRAFT_273913 [Sphaerobolus stellatus SS14]